MIEMVYRGTSKDGKGKERTGLPKNIRQIGDAGSDKRVYIEDYVITFLEKTGCAVLLGEVWQNENMKCLFADGAVEIAEGEPKLLEVNTTPGMTATSFIPQQVRAAGLEMKDVMTDIIENEFN